MNEKTYEQMKKEAFMSARRVFLLSDLVCCDMGKEFKNKKEDLSAIHKYTEALQKVESIYRESLANELDYFGIAKRLDEAKKLEEAKKIQRTGHYG